MYRSSPSLVRSSLSFFVASSNVFVYSGDVTRCRIAREQAVWKSWNASQTSSMFGLFATEYSLLSGAKVGSSVVEDREGEVFAVVLHPHHVPLHVLEHLRPFERFHG